MKLWLSAVVAVVLMSQTLKAEVPQGQPVMTQLPASAAQAINGSAAQPPSVIKKFAEVANACLLQQGIKADPAELVTRALPQADVHR